MAMLLLILVSAIVLPLGIWHHLGYYNGRYDRWSAEQAKQVIRRL